MFKAFAVGKHHLHTFAILFGYKIDAIGIFLQVVSNEVNPEMGRIQLPVSRKMERRFSRGAGAAIQCFRFQRFFGIETNHIEFVVIASRL